MDKNINKSGYDLYELEKDLWIIHDKDTTKVFSGTFRQIVLYSFHTLGFKIQDIEIAVNEMLKNSHNAAHFGMYRSFIYTFYKEFNNKKVG